MGVPPVLRARLPRDTGVSPVPAHSMTPRQLNLTLWSLTAILALAAAACAFWGLTSPVTVDASAPDPRRSTPSTTQSASSALPPLSAFEPLWSLPLRKPLTDSSTTAGASNNTQPTPPQPAPGASLSFTLVGTIGDSLAMIRTATGQIEVKSVGEESAGAKIVAIRPYQIDVQFNGQLMTLITPKEPPDGG